ncbi:MAG: hypothetical protein AMXMBFR81_22170 [Chthonomonas sp.]
MERLKPIDLERIVLPRGIGGYKRRVVDDLLLRAAKEIETLLNELRIVQDHATQQERELERFRAQEHVLKESILLAQKTADETRALAHREGEVMLQEARQRMAEETRAAEEKLKELHWQLEQIELDRMRFRRQFRAVLEEHLKALDEPQPTLTTYGVVGESGPGESESL